MVAAVTYDELSFWAGVATGCRLKGYTGYGTMPGWDPDGDLIVRPITQGVPSIYFGADHPFAVHAFADTVEIGWPEQTNDTIRQSIGIMSFGQIKPFTVIGFDDCAEAVAEIL